MFKKRILSCLLAITLIFSLYMVAVANESIEASSADDQETQWIEDTEDIYSIIVDQFAQTPNYAGAYFMDSILHISTTDKTASEKFMATLKNTSDLTVAEMPEIAYNEVKYTYSELASAKNLIVSRKSNVDVTGAYTDPITNTVIVETTGSPSELSRGLSRSFAGPIDFSSIIIEQVFEENEDFATPIRGGYYINNPTRNTSFSMGSGIKWNKTGQLGYITAAHEAVKTGDVFTYNNVNIGIAETVRNSGTMDVALIRSTNSNYYASNKNGTSGLVCSSNGAAIVNDNVSAFGAATGQRSGKITAVDYTFTMDEGAKTYTDMIRTDFTMAKGDSGGSLIAIRSSANVFIGIIKGGTPTTTYCTKWTNIRDTYDLVRVSSAE